ncbi:acetyl-CoA synthetase-like protein [Aspergillus heteromorphus CBS 117.55]|uniref:Very long-chain fatty acid transport protein n=1 Tax=Aspergillus heteromorphus CBS 117.55 TaxID=1448321 RepID=A0A317VK56_9EURO|nr:acetyl-CoA synthetase-like protein [Aspergillus heteromorphus CBS 117.55]PWY72290.1 acetyl-CoA synthetase-like protein [Aspergillus heteromorphus CBS 117.55]
MALATAATLTLAAYLDAKFHLTRDGTTLLGQRRALRAVQHAASSGRINPWLLFLDAATTHPDMVCLWTRDRSYTYRQTLAAATQYAHFYRIKGVHKGDLVAFYLQTRPEFIFAWLGLWSIGCAPAAINYHLTGDALTHCLAISGARIVLVDPEADCRARIDAKRHPIEEELQMEIIPLDEAFTATLSALPSHHDQTAANPSARNTPPSFPAILLYTSGTTGHPKGCPFTMSRLQYTAALRRLAASDSPGPAGDRWYSAMPLYHGTSAISLIGNLLNGRAIAIAPRFRVSTFWSDIRDSQSTVFVYVGEAARYLLAAPPSPLDRAHRLRMMYGNGLRPDVWERFRQRFGVPEVGEFFNSTEGVFTLFNLNKGPFTAGSVGHHGALMRRLMRDVYVPVAVEAETGEILRDDRTGLAVRRGYEQGGEILVRVPDEKAFAGYWGNEQATRKKFVGDVLRKGDLWYRSGDALRRDADGRWFFLDRLGDTFRWKSENVLPNPRPLPGNPRSQRLRRADPAPRRPRRLRRPAPCPGPNSHSHSHSHPTSTDIRNGVGIDMTALATFLHARLPRYAVPVFLRIVQSPSHIHNHKQNKGPLREEGVDPGKIGTQDVEGRGDRLFWLPPGQGERQGYVPFGEGEWAGISEGRARL